MAWSEQTLALVRLASGLVQPRRVGRHPCQLRRLEVGVVPEQSTRVVQHLGVVGIRAAQLERDGDGVAVAIEVGIGPLQVQSDQPPQGTVPGRLTEGLLEPGHRFLMAPDLGQRHRQQGVHVRETRLQCEGATQRRHGVCELPLLEVNQPEPRVHFRPFGLERPQSLVRPLRLGVAPAGECPFALLEERRGLGGRLPRRRRGGGRGRRQGDDASDGPNGGRSAAAAPADAAIIARRLRR